MEKRHQHLLSRQNGLKRLPVFLLSLLLVFDDFRGHAVAERGLGQSHEHSPADHESQDATHQGQRAVAKKYPGFMLDD